MFYIEVLTKLDTIICAFVFYLYLLGGNLAMNFEICLK
jgi:hypothetical protein